MRKAHRYDGVDFTGYRHERLLVIKKADFGITQWVCKCDCGRELTLPANKIVEYKSCGCLEKENKKNLAKKSITHGMTKTILYSKYYSMRARCENPNYKHYDRYGGRGIKVCDEWKNSFESFAKWAYENGYDDNKKRYEQTLDRIKNNGNYEPNNCRWVNQKNQVKNRSNSTNIKINGEYLNPHEISIKYGIKSEAFIRRRFSKGEDIEKILHDWDMLYNTPENYMTVKNASFEYGVSEESILMWIKKGYINAEKVGLKWFIDRNQSTQNFRLRSGK